MRRIIRTTVSAPHTTSSQNNPGVIDHLGTDVEPVPKAAADKLWLWPPQPSFRTRAPRRNYRPVGKALGGVFGVHRRGGCGHRMLGSRVSGTSLKTCLGPTLQAAPAPSFAIIMNESFQGDTNGHDNDP